MLFRPEHIIIHINARALARVCRESAKPEGAGTHRVESHPLFYSGAPRERCGEGWVQSADTPGPTYGSEASAPHRRTVLKADYITASRVLFVVDRRCPPDSGFALSVVK